MNEIQGMDVIQEMEQMKQTGVTQVMNNRYFFRKHKIENPI